MASTHRITIKQIAKEAGVSKQTVSRVLNNRPDVSPKTRQKVQSIIDRNGYQPSKLARGLTRGRTYTIGVVSSDLQHFGPSQTLMGINKEARCRGYTLSLSLVHELNRDSAKTILGNLLAQHVDGVIWAAVVKEGEAQDQVLASLTDLPIPVVANTKPDSLVRCVYVNNCLGSQQAAAHLVGQGYRQVGIITGPLNEWSAQQRLRGWRQGLAKMGQEATADLIATGDWTAVSGAAALRQLLKQQPELDAIFVSNDHMALGVLKEAQAMGLRIPQDLGVVGFDDIPEAEYFTPSLTTVRQDLVQIGRLLVSELDKAMNQQESNDQATVTEIHPQLIIRASSTAQRFEPALL